MNDFNCVTFMHLVLTMFDYIVHFERFTLRYGFVFCRFCRFCTFCNRLNVSKPMCYAIQTILKLLVVTKFQQKYHYCFPSHAYCCSISRILTHVFNYAHIACQYRPRNLRLSRQIRSLITFSLVNLELLHPPETSFLFFPLETKIVVDTGRGSISFVHFRL